MRSKGEALAPYFLALYGFRGDSLKGPIQRRILDLALSSPPYLVEAMLNIQNLIDDAKCFETVRDLRWTDGLLCPHCRSDRVVKRGFDDTQPHRQRYHCQGCERDFDDLTDTVFAGHHQPLHTWILCLYFMGLNLSNQQIARELDLNKDDVQQMTTQLREGIVRQKTPVRLADQVECDEVYIGVCSGYVYFFITSDRTPR